MLMLVILVVAVLICGAIVAVSLARAAGREAPVAPEASISHNDAA